MKPTTRPKANCTSGRLSAPRSAMNFERVTGLSVVYDGHHQERVGEHHQRGEHLVARGVRRWGGGSVAAGTSAPGGPGAVRGTARAWPHLTPRVHGATSTGSTRRGCGGALHSRRSWRPASASPSVQAAVARVLASGPARWAAAFFSSPICFSSSAASSRQEQPRRDVPVAVLAPSSCRSSTSRRPPRGTVGLRLHPARTVRLAADDLQGSLLLFGCTAVLFWYVSLHNHEWWVLPVVYVWVGMFGVVAPAQVWTLANYVLTTREAKRLFGFIGSGATSGPPSAASSCSRRCWSSAPRARCSRWPSRSSCSAILVELLWRRRHLAQVADYEESETATATRRPDRPALEPEADRGSPYLTAIAAVICLSSCTTAVVAWQFKAMTSHVKHESQQMAAFFGAFTFWAGAASLVLAVAADVARAAAARPGVRAVRRPGGAHTRIVRLPRRSARSRPWSRCAGWTRCCATRSIDRPSNCCTCRCRRNTPSRSSRSSTR